VTLTTAGPDSRGQVRNAIAAIAIGGTIGLDAMFGGPISGASMNPMRSLGPGLVSGDLHAIWVYLLAPVAGTAIGGLAYQFVRGETSSLGPDGEPS
jgi:aquaporin NIP